MKATNVRPEQPKMPVETKPCLECGKILKHPYGTFREGWVCSNACNKAHNEKRYA